MAIPPPPGFNNRMDARLQPEPEPDPFSPDNTDNLLDTEISFFFKANLTPEQQKNIPLCRFIVEYFKCRNNVQSCRAAGVPVSRGQSWLRNAHVFDCIKAMTNKQLMKYAYDENEVMARIKEIAEVDPIELQNPDGTFKTRMEDIRPEVRRAIKKFKAKNLWRSDANGMRELYGVLVEVEFWSKEKTLEMLGIEKDLLKKTTKVEHTVSAQMADILLESGSRADQHRIESAREVTPRIEGSVSGGSESTENQGY